MRIGFGYDVHRLVAGRRLMLGGLHIPFDRGLDGHSDADVLLHAIADAMLGAAALGDIGVLFPDTDPEWQGADSAVLLAEVADRIREAGFRVGNIDATVVAEHPKLRPHIDAMRTRIATILDIEIVDVSVKATTSERMGFVGEERGMAAQAVCVLL